GRLVARVGVRSEAAARGLALARARAWFEAHEALEDAWRDERDPRRRELLRALVHACVSLEHRRRGNPTGADLQLAKARARVASADPADPLAPVARAWIEAIAALEPDRPEERWPTP